MVTANKSLIINEDRRGSEIGLDFDLIRQDRQLSCGHDSMLGQLFGMVGHSTTLQDQAVRVNDQTKIAYPPIQPALDVYLKAVDFVVLTEANVLCDDLRTHDATSEVTRPHLSPVTPATGEGR
jgi:hypothetical protein